MTPSNISATASPKSNVFSKRVLVDFERVVKEVGAFAVEVGDTLRANPKAAAPFIRECVGATPLLFQKWNLEILYLLGLVPTLRFSQLKDYLDGISSRTLSLKLDELESNGLVDRRVFPEKPLRVEYSLTSDGRTIARLTLPLVMFLNLREERGPQAPELAPRSA